MILSRITRALRDQNWLAVGIEFVIVALGIVLGFQVNEWAQKQARSVRAEEMMARMAVDLEAELWRVTAISRYLEDMSSEALDALDAIRGAQELDDETLVIKAFRGSQYYWSGVISSTYDELVASSEINLLPDGAFRDAAIEYYNSSSASLLAEPGDTPYRNAFRQHISPRLHRALIAACAEDPTIKIGDYEALDNFLTFPCEIEGMDIEIADLAARLRNDESLSRLLRWRVIRADQDKSNLVYYRDLLHTALEIDREMETRQ